MNTWELKVVRKIVLLKAGFFLLLLFSTDRCSALLTASTLSLPEVAIVSIYRKADLALVQEKYLLEFKKGKNILEFGLTENIDKDSLLLRILENEDKVKIEERKFLPASNKIIWEVSATDSLRTGLEVVYFIGGISWNAIYYLDAREKDSLSLSCFVEVENKSGRDFPLAKIRLISGQPHLLREEKREFLKSLAQTWYQEKITPEIAPTIEEKPVAEYHVYDFKEKISLKEGKKYSLALFTAEDIPCEILYRFNFRKEGNFPSLVYRFKNLLSFPFPEGTIMGWFVREEGKDYLGRNTLPYTPAGEEVEISLGKENRLKMERKLSSFLRNGLEFSFRGIIVKYEQEEEYTLSLRNFFEKKVRIKIVEEIPGEWVLVTSSIPAVRKQAEVLEFDTLLLPAETKNIIYKIKRTVRVK
ncbi:DUF4139 domain-containing protein [Candidatus Aerophobetes bacterium]|nr:DUF4139 domain-containing protein [Candidatus Aerophobetes bacterium]